MDGLRVMLHPKGKDPVPSRTVLSRFVSSREHVALADPSDLEVWHGDEVVASVPLAAHRWYRIESVNGMLSIFEGYATESPAASVDIGQFLVQLPADWR